MLARPASVPEAQELLRGHYASSVPCAGLDLSALTVLVAHSPEDMTATAQSGMTLRDFQTHLRKAGQWLPIDPPAFQDWTIRDLIELNLNGPRRFGYGLVRDYLIGIRVVLPDGRLIKAGGNVVKNVAGYDLCKLFVGSKGTLGITVEATFKLRPLPEASSSVQFSADSVKTAGLFLEKIAQSPLCPAILDLVSAGDKHDLRMTFEGAAEDVQYQLRVAAEMGISEKLPSEEGLDFWKAAPQHVAVLPSALAPALEKLRPAAYQARAGNGIIYFTGGAAIPPALQPVELVRRIKAAYDPKNILPSSTP